MGTRAETKKTEGKSKAPLRFSTVNGLLAGAGVLTVALGFFLLSKGSITAAPLLLVLGYVILLPLAIIL